MLTNADTTGSTRVLTGAIASGQTLEMIRQSNGSLCITIEGSSEPVLAWPSDDLEQCVNVYLALLRSGNST